MAMAVSTTVVSIRARSTEPSPAASAPAAHFTGHRRISYKAAHALEVLGHAIEYLSEEFGDEEACTSAERARLEAVQLLMARNHEIYFACPEVPSFMESIRSFLRLHLD